MVTAGVKPMIASAAAIDPPSPQVPAGDQGAFHRLTDRLPHGVVVHRGFKPLYANPAAARVLGFDGVEALMRMDSLAPMLSEDPRFAIQSEAIDWLDGPAHCVSVTAGSAPHERRTNHRHLFDNVPDGFYRASVDGKLLDANPAMAAMLGFDGRDDLMSAINGGEFQIYAVPGERQKLVRQLLEDGQVLGYHVQWLHRGGQLIWVSLNVNAVAGPGGEVETFEGSVVDVTLQREAVLALIRSKEEADLANRTKSEFLAHMSHELRTPLNCVIGFSQILMGEMFGPLGSDNYREYAADINTAGNHLLRLISDILDISKIEAGELEITDEEVDIGAVLYNCMTMMRERADHAGIIIGVEFDHDIPRIIADELRIKQVLLNLMSNAIKFTAPGGRVAAGAFIGDDGGMVLYVRDSGAGIPPEDIERVLAPFEQARGSVVLAHEGTGLGLFLTKILTEMHGGRLQLESVVGQGTKVTIHLPPERTLPLDTEFEDPAQSAD